MQLLTEISINFFLIQETQFVVDEVSNVIKEAIETTIGGNSYTVNTITNIVQFEVKAPVRTDPQVE